MQQPGAEIIVGGRYRLHNLLGTGGIGVVYQATDLLLDTDVALKLLKIRQTRPGLGGVDETTQARLILAREFRLLAALRHPHIISVLDYGFDEDNQPYYTMELLHDPQTVLQAGRDHLPLARVDLIIQLLQALVYLHRRNILHRDLKPTNIMIEANDDWIGPLGTRCGRLKLLDFGLAERGGQVRPADNVAAGTLFYMAPEILAGEQHTEQSDLYAVGLILYELFAGKYPFQLDSISRLIETLKHQPPDLTLLDAAPALRNVIGRLLEKDPQRRYASAHDLILALCTAIDVTPPPESIAIRESFLQSAELVGRGPEIADLTAALTDAMNGYGSVCLVSGESGVGKSRLLDELRSLALVNGALVLRSQARREGGPRYLLWRRILQRLILMTPLDEDQATLLKPILPELDRLIGRPVAASGAGDVELSAVVCDLVARQAQPCVILLEDIQWMREEEYALFRALCGVVDQAPVLVVASYSVDQTPNIPIELPRARLLYLDRLTTEEIAHLSEAILGPGGRAPHIVAFLERETEGNAFFLIEVIRALAEVAGNLEGVGSIILPEMILPDPVRQVVRRRLERVPGNCMNLLRLSAVIGRQMNLDLLASLEPEEDIPRWLETCGDAAVFDVHEGRWRFAHEKLRELLLESMTSSERRALHERVAHAIESLDGDVLVNADLLAYHWAQAGDLQQAEHYRRLSSPPPPDSH